MDVDGGGASFGTDALEDIEGFRSTRAQQLHAAGVPDSSIIELLGWGIESGQRMLHR